MKYLRWLVKLLLIVGALNWGLIGFFKYNLITDLFGMDSAFTRLIFDLIGLAGLFAIAALCKCCTCGTCPCTCKKGHEQGPGQHHQM